MYASIYLTIFVFHIFFFVLLAKGYPLRCADMFEAFLFASHTCPFICDVHEAYINTLFSHSGSHVRVLIAK